MKLKAKTVVFVFVPIIIVSMMVVVFRVVHYELISLPAALSVVDANGIATKNQQLQQALITSETIINDEAYNSMILDDAHQQEETMKSYSSANSIANIKEEEGQRPIRPEQNAKQQRTRIRLPSFENGGLIFFYHVPKTGGTTIRDNLSKLPGVTHLRCSSTNSCLIDWKNKTRHTIDKYLMSGNDDDIDVDHFHKVKSKTKKKRTYDDTDDGNNTDDNNSEFQRQSPYNNNNNTTIFFLEKHGNSIGLLDLKEDLQRWRKLATRRNKSFFAFTVVREPVSFAISYFRFFHLNPNYKWTEPRQYTQLTDENIIDAQTIANRQCVFLSQLRFQNGQQRMNPPVTSKECSQNTYEEVMKTELDWVGTTENLSSMTMPLLLSILTTSTTRRSSDDDEEENAIDFVNERTKISSSSVVSSNVNQDKRKIEKLQNSTLEYLKYVSRYDRNIYDNVRKDFTLKNFKN